MHRSLAYQKYPSRLVTLIIIDWVHFECDLLMHVEFSRGFVGGPHIHGRSSWEGMPGTGGVDNVGGWEIIGQPGQSSASLLLHLSTSRHRVPQPRESKFKMGVMPVAALSTFYHCSMRYGLELWHASADQPCQSSQHPVLWVCGAQRQKCEGFICIGLWTSESLTLPPAPWPIAGQGRAVQIYRIWGASGRHNGLKTSSAPQSHQAMGSWLPCNGKGTFVYYVKCIEVQFLYN